MEIGLLGKENEYIKFGHGGETLVVFPPMNDALFKLDQICGYYQWIFRGLARSYTIYVISRKRNLPVGYSTQEMAADYGKVFSKHLGPAHILGISLGGLIAQYFAHDFPQYTRSLVNIAAAHHMGTEGLTVARRWIPWARHGQWRTLHKDMVTLSYTGIHYMLFMLGTPFIGGYLLNKISHPADFITAGQAGMIHDSSELLPEITARTLMIGGDRDLLFPAPLLREMASRMPHAKLHLIKGAAHGVYDENSGCIDPWIHQLIHECSAPTDSCASIAG